MTAPLTATVTRPEPPPEPVRPRIRAAVAPGHCGLWDLTSNILAYRNQPGYREITIPTDAEAKAFAEYVALTETALRAWRNGKSDAVHLSHLADRARAAYEAERSKP